MVDYDGFKKFEVDSNLLLVGEIASRDGSAQFYAPRSAFFTTPPLSNGDTFNFHQALEDAPSLEIDIVSDYSGVITKEVVQRVAVMQAYIEDDAVKDIASATVFPGNPPRYRFGSYTEAVNGVVTKYGLLNYRRQAFGQRLLLLDRDVIQGVYGFQAMANPNDPGDGSFYDDILVYNFQDYLWHIEHCHSISLHLESAITSVPLTFTIYGRVVFDYTGLYTYPLSQTEGPPLILVKSVMSSSPRRMAPHGVGWDGGAFSI